MMRSFLVLVAALFLSPAAADSVDVTPLTKVISMLSELGLKIVGEGQTEQNVYTRFSEWCETRSRELHFDIKTGNSQIDELTATIVDETALAGKLNAKIEELAATIAQDESDVSDATKVRNKGHEDFLSEETELTQTISMIKRAKGILEREMAKTDSSTGAYLQQNGKHAGDLTQALKALVDASMFSFQDASKLTALVQSSQQSDDDDMGANAPASKEYAGQSGGVIDTLQDLLAKADAQLAEARKEESNEAQNFKMLRQPLEDAIKFANAELAEAKKDLQASNERKATAESDKRETIKTRNEDQAALDEAHNNCLNRANEYQASMKSRGQELDALSKAQHVLEETTSGANEVTYGLAQTASFLQLAGRSQLTSKVDLKSYEAARFVRDLAKKEGSPALAQLASRMIAAVRVGGRSSDDVFTKVKGLIADMIVRLTEEGEADKTHEEWCRRELAESEEKEDNKNAEIAKLTASIDKMSARSAKLKTQTAELQKQLAELAASQAAMDETREAEHNVFLKDESEQKQGLEGVKTALRVLSDYYAGDASHKAAEGAAAGIIGFIETIESQITKKLAEITEDEESALAAYDQETKENQVEKATKVQSVRYKSQEFIELDKAISQASTDRSGVQDELTAIMNYLKELHSQCDEVAEPYHVRKERREREINGLKEALSILQNEGVDMAKINGPVAVSF